MYITYMNLKYKGAYGHTGLIKTYDALTIYCGVLSRDTVYQFYSLEAVILPNICINVYGLKIQKATDYIKLW
jgi:hypothetical protein